MIKKVIAFGCWNNERHIAIPGCAGKLHPILLTTEKRAREYYPVGDVRASDDPIVRVTVELIEEDSNENQPE
jgi:hypothetical protein